MGSAATQAFPWRFDVAQLKAKTEVTGSVWRVTTTIGQRLE